MFKKIKPYFKLILFYALLIYVLTFKLPFLIEKPGGLIDVSDRVYIADSFDFEGSFHITYVSEMRATLITYLLSFFNKDWELIPIDDTDFTLEMIEQFNVSSLLSLEESKANAIYIGMSKAGVDVELVNQKVYVSYVFAEASTDLVMNDQIVSVNGVEVLNRAHLSSLITVCEVGEEIVFEVMRDSEKISATAKVFEIEGVSLVGIAAICVSDVETDLDYDFSFKGSESGSSGGLMMSLAIYNYLTDFDLSRGKKIVGTGTINEEGEVGAIGGIGYKILTAEKENADVFFIPLDNKEEAMETINSKNVDLNYVFVSTIDEVIEYLKNFD